LIYEERGYELNNRLKEKINLARAMAQTLGCSMVKAGRAMSMNLDEYQTVSFGNFV